ncbi:hypothetical protein M0638_27010 [Roseomonas sp. NAR14]|uniref:Uncharacterized protein n=1 Tax=Roseomonas acroporae TaxID=2937791 RepID=A0A9X1YL68_9PROT|nr:hypothetical protein [Roseomonas acroporae]MCK8788011.1 hypothetical protein [Roseomonas acroporae]
MAVIDLGIVNRALSRLAARTPVSSIDENSTEAAYARTFYPSTLAATLAMLDWGFARAVQAMPLVGTAPPPWAYQYMRPDDCLTPRAVLGQAATFPGAWPVEDCTIRVPFAAGSARDAGGAMVPVIRTNMPGASLLYTRLVEETGLWEPGFAEAFTWALAADLALPITGKADIQRAMLEGRAAALSQAAVNTMQGRTVTALHEPDWLAGRDPGAGGRCPGPATTTLPVTPGGPDETILILG